MKGFERMLKAVGLAAAASALPMESKAQEAPVPPAENVMPGTADFTDPEAPFPSMASDLPAYGEDGPVLDVARPEEASALDRIQERFNEDEPLTIAASSLPWVPDTATTHSVRVGGMEVAGEDAVGISYRAVNRPRQD